MPNGGPSQSSHSKIIPAAGKQVDERR